MNPLRRVAVIAACVDMLMSFKAHAGTLHVLNVLRLKECGHPIADGEAFHSNAKLIKAAGYVRNGFTLRDALKRAEYRADQSAVIKIGGGVMGDETLHRMLAKNNCATLTDPGLVEVGISSSGNEIALVFASPFTPPDPKDARQISLQVLKLVNEARAKSRRCGSKKFRAVSPLELNDRLLRAATAHAKDMAAHGRMSHEGSDHSLPDQRITRSGYAWRSVGENVAAGQLSAQEVVAGWLASPGHCVNIMDPDFTQMAVAYVINPKQEIGIYWAQEFGQPQ